MTSISSNRVAGDAIRKLRNSKALTQDDLAARSGLGIATIYRAERGLSVSAETLASIAAALDINASDLIWADAEDAQPYLPLDEISGGRALAGVLHNAGRLDFDYEELETLDQANEVEALHSFCTRLIEEGMAISPIVRTARDLEAKAILSRLQRWGFVVSGSAFDVRCHEIDEEDGMNISVCYGQWDERCAVIRVGIGGLVKRAYVLERLGKYESPKGDEVVFPQRASADSDGSLWNAFLADAQLETEGEA